MPLAPTAVNRRLLLPYALPFAVYVGIGTLPSDWVGRELNYVLRLVVTSGTLAWAWRSYVPLRGPRSPAGSLAVGTVAGLVGTVVWVAMLQSLVGSGGEPWNDTAFALRLLASATLVPVFEELLMRGYALRFALQWDLARRDPGAAGADPLGVALDQRSIADVAPGAATPLAVAISTGLFMAGHGVEQYPAAFAYGVLMASLWIVRGDLLTCVTAHAVTNATLALYIRASGAWTLW
jgi:membrane protease YdiL (CAAX protease family)